MIKDKSNSEHYYWGEKCEGWRIVDKKNLTIIEEEMPPDTAEKFHFHKKAEQLFRVIAGTACFEVNNQKYNVTAGQSFYLKPNLIHRILNNTNEVLKFIVISHPSTKNDRFEEDENENKKKTE